MTKDEFKKRMDDAGDAYVTYRTKNSKRLKYNICTRDFETPYIKNRKNRAKESSSTVLLFCWDTDSYRLLDPRNVTKILPLNKVVKNDWIKYTTLLWKRNILQWR